MALSVRVTPREEIMIKDFARLQGQTVPSFIKETLMRRIEDEIDLETYHKALQAYRDNPITYSLDEVEAEILG